MDVCKVIFQLDKMDAVIGGEDNASIITAQARAVNEAEPGQLHPQPVILHFDLEGSEVGRNFLDLRDLQKNGCDIRCIGHFLEQDDVTQGDSLFDHFYVTSFEIAYDYGLDSDIEENKVEIKVGMAANSSVPEPA